MSWIERNKLILILFLICFVGFFLRFYTLGGESYWFDEKMSLYFSQNDLVSVLNPPSYETHIPPLYYILLHFWAGIFGTGEFAVRSLSAVFGSLSTVALYKLGKYLFNVKVALCSSLIFAVSIFHIYFSQEARMYSLLTFTTLLSVFFFLKSINENRLRFWVSYIIVSILMLYTHLYGIFIIAFQFFYFLFYYRTKIGYVKNCLAAFFLVAVGFSPWLIKLFGVTPYILEGYSAIAWIPEPNIILIVGTALIFCNNSVVDLLVFGYSFRSIFQLEGIKKRFSKAAFSGSLKRMKAYFLDSSKFSINFCFFWMGIPIILALSISLILQPIYLPKYLILVTPAFYLLVAKGLTKMNRKIRYILLLILLIDSALISYSYYTNFNKEQWREVAFYVQAREEPGDLIIINAPWLKLSFEHYYNGNSSVIAVQTTSQVDEALTIEHNNVWLILSHDDVSDPTEQVKSRLDETLQLNSEKEFVSQDILDNISFFGYPITDFPIKIKIYHYST